jgi:hypothetical protein
LIVESSSRLAGELAAAGFTVAAEATGGPTDVRLRLVDVIARSGARGAVALVDGAATVEIWCYDARDATFTTKSVQVTSDPATEPASLIAVRAAELARVVFLTLLRPLPAAPPARPRSVVPSDDARALFSALPLVGVLASFERLGAAVAAGLSLRIEGRRFGLQTSGWFPATTVVARDDVAAVRIAQTVLAASALARLRSGAVASGRLDPYAGAGIAAYRVELSGVALDPYVVDPVVRWSPAVVLSLGIRCALGDRGVADLSLTAVESQAAPRVQLGATDAGRLGRTSALLAFALGVRL